MTNRTKLRLAWKYRRFLWKYRNVLMHRKEIMQAAVTGAAIGAAAMAGRSKVE
jgi:hypothetical protein